MSATVVSSDGHAFARTVQELPRPLPGSQRRYDGAVFTGKLEHQAAVECYVNIAMPSVLQSYPPGIRDLTFRFAASLRRFLILLHIFC